MMMRMAKRTRVDAITRELGDGGRSDRAERASARVSARRHARSSSESTGLPITKRPAGYERPATFTDSCGHLDEHLGSAPGHLERHLQPSADVDGRAGLERHGVGRLEATGHLDLRPGGGDL